MYTLGVSWVFVSSAESEASSWECHVVVRLQSSFEDACYD